MTAINDDAIDRLFRNARTFGTFRDQPVPDEMLRRVYDLACMAPTSANSNPGRFVFVRSPEAKARLAAALSAGNLDKTMAPVTALVAYDTEFHEHLPRLFPHTDARSWFAGKHDFIVTTAFRNSSLQGAYFILAARALGLDCGPMSGFDNAKVDAAFFPDGKWKSNFLINLGHGDATRTKPRNPRLSFEEACRIL